MQDAPDAEGVHQETFSLTFAGCIADGSASCADNRKGGHTASAPPDSGSVTRGKQQDAYLQTQLDRKAPASPRSGGGSRGGSPLSQPL